MSCGKTHFRHAMTANMKNMQTEPRRWTNKQQHHCRNSLKQQETVFEDTTVLQACSLGMKHTQPMSIRKHKKEDYRQKSQVEPQLLQFRHSCWSGFANGAAIASGHAEKMPHQLVPVLLLLMLLHPGLACDAMSCFPSSLLTGQAAVPEIWDRHGQAQ